ncbi:YEATS domain-containing protein 2 isoform X3 [Rhinatrema bivittatum]|nr:YEATS domain-containing protein 2 isoform X3 [Rhinatrema bivittatum]XP_029472870.1 YEATS domain-containing protein 2 isoform X3 [Rhinatrema bivittatum]XP_029472871.1 YEATS domain-containing protein 2 isoform X3 [Rhinatrema bivittatum]XP_029472872.1 YEATS domain-containing protein 2 isoform X3 [Rhinatrema bivittatum]
MSGIKRVIEDNDPDYDEISAVHQNKRHKLIELSGRDAAIQKIEAIIKEQFTIEMKNKEHEIEVIDQRLIEARRMMDKLRACIVANYYASASRLKVPEGSKSCDALVFNHPSIKKFLESPSRSSSPINQRSETPSVNYSETDSLSQHNDFLTDKDTCSLDMYERMSSSMESGSNARQDNLGVTDSEITGCLNVNFTCDDASRLYLKKTIVVGNVSKYIPPDKREESDQSTHKWMVYVRGSRKEPSISHFVKKVWFFLHPSYKPNDLVEVREPPFHLTRRGWGEFPVRVQIHFKDSHNKRIDIIHNLKLDRTYTGLQTLGAETVVDVQLHRHSLGEEYLFSQSSNESTFSDIPPAQPSLLPAATQVSSPSKQSQESIPDASVEKGFSANETERLSSFYPLQSSLEHTPTKLRTQKVMFGSPGNSAFQPITASCKIVPQGQTLNHLESPGKSFQPITMSCKIVSGSPISTPSPSPLPRTPTSTPVPLNQGTASSGITNPYVIVDKMGQVTTATVTNTGSQTSKHVNVSLASPGAGSPIPKVNGSSFVTSVKQEESLFAAMPPLCPIGSRSKVQSPKPVSGGLGAFTKVIIKQEPVDPPQQQVPIPVSASQPTLQQYVTVKGGHVIAVSPQKQIAGTEGPAQTKVVGIAGGAAVHSAVKQAVAIGGQILVAKSSSSVAKTVGPKQVVAQGVAKAVMSGGGTAIVAQPVQTLTKAQVTSAGAPKPVSQGSVMATLQLPATNLANLANLPPGTKLYLTTNSKNPTGKGKLLLIPQGAILRATSNTSLQAGSSASSGGGTQSAAGGLSQHLTYTSYILKQTPQGTFLVGQPSTQASGKQLTSVLQGNVGLGTSVQGQQALKVIAGQKAAVFAQTTGGQTLLKVSDGTQKSVAAPSQLSKAGPTMLRVTGGVITTANTTSAAVLSANGLPQQPAEGVGSSSSSAVTPLLKPSGPQQQVLASESQTLASAAVKPMSTAVSVSSPTTVPCPSSSKAEEAVPEVQDLPGKLSHGIAKDMLLSDYMDKKCLFTGSLQDMSKLSAAAPISTINNPAISATDNNRDSYITADSPSTAAIKVKAEPDLAGQNDNALILDGNSAPVKSEEACIDARNYAINTEHLENIQQLLTAVVKKIPLIASKNEDANSLCASSIEQYYDWNIGKRRAAEWQRAVTMRKVLQEIFEREPRFYSTAFLKTKHVVHWCRCHGYTPPDPETLRNEEESIEDVLTQIDSEPEYPSSYSCAEELCQKLEELQQLLKRETEKNEEVDIVNITEPLKMNIKKEEEENEEELKFHLPSVPTSEFIRDTAQEIGISFQPVELQKNVFAAVIEEMILKATEQFMSDILRNALAVGYQTTPHNRSPKEISMMNMHQAICNIPFLDFLTNKHLGGLNVEQ